MNIPPLDLSLFIAFSLFIGLFLSGLFNLADKNKPFDPNVLLPLLLKIGFISIIFIVIIAYVDKDLAKALSPTLIVISAFIASASVMKSIDAHKKLENEKNNRLKQRNISILIINLESLSGEIDEQIHYLNSTSIDQLDQYRYSEHLNDQLLYRVVEKITGLEINEYNPYETIEEINNIKKTIFRRIHQFDLIFRKLEEVDSIKIDSVIKEMIKQDVINSTTNTKSNSLYIEIHNYEMSIGVTHASRKDINSVWDNFLNIKVMINQLIVDLNSDKISINNFIDKVNNV